MRTESAFRFDLVPVDTSERPLTFAFSIALLGKTAWPVAGEPCVTVEVQIDDLFSYLVEFWRPLLLRQTYPLGLTPIRPSLLVRTIEERWKDQPQHQVDEEADVLGAFEDAHDLSRAFGGLFDLPHFWMLREGDRMLCDTGTKLWRLPFDTVYAELTAVGDRIAEHLLALAPDKWDRVVDAWRRRQEIDRVELVAWSASVDQSVAEVLVKSGALEAPDNLGDAANDNDPLLIAARMAGELPTDQIVRIIEIAKSFKAHKANALDALSGHCLERLAQHARLPGHSQGETIAREVREHLGLSPSERVDIFALLANLGVEIQSRAVEPNTFDGLAIAGGRYGPGAFLNEASKRFKELDDLSRNVGARVTLAHEFCHLLLDREHPLSAVEVLRSRMPASVEARAKAFAGEFLLPTTAATDLWDRAGAPIDKERLEPVLQELADHFGVSFSVAAWKLEHGSGTQRHRLRPVLDALAPYR